MTLSLFTILLFWAGSVSAAEQQSTIPTRFHGEWNSNLKHCGTVLNDSRLMIGAERIEFHESGGPIRAVVTQCDLKVALISELSGEGETWLTYNQFSLSEDSMSLTDISIEPYFVRYRCP